ncbi:MAG: imidazolonepropionase [Deltaproteobacteria bacterium]|nr:imidazolonepropionase [Deltaproteobacteria bacterium]
MTSVPTRILLRHARELLTMDGAALDPKRPHDTAPLAMILDGAVLIEHGVIADVGTTASLCARTRIDADTLVVDVGDRVIAPGLIDSHTHSLFVGHRADEFVARIEGASYAEIAAKGGGIARSVRELRQAKDSELDGSLHARLRRMVRYGVTTVECKSGYGLDTESELRSLAAMERAEASSGLTVLRTFLPLHAVDPSLRTLPEGRARFLKRTLEETVVTVLREARPHFVDAYIDGPGFSVEETRPLLEAARNAGTAVRLHVGQFADVGGAELAAEFAAASADHLEFISDSGMAAMAHAGVVATLLPGAAFSLGQTMPDGRRMRDAGLSVAVATDCNPGTSYLENLPLAAAFAVRSCGLSTVEAWCAITRVAAHSLRLNTGKIAVGSPASLCVLDIPTWTALPYAIGSVQADWVYHRGRVLHDRMRES